MEQPPEVQEEPSPQFKLDRLTLGLIAYGELCQIHDLRRRFSFRTRTRLDHSRAFV